MTPTRTIACVALLLLVQSPWSAHAHSHDTTASPDGATPAVVEPLQNGTAYYLANEGVLVELGEVKVLFDAFFSNGYGNYSLVPQPSVAALNAGTPPYDGIDALFISHAHGDHFSPKPTLAWLRAQPNARLIGPKEAVQALLALVDDEDPISKRLTALELSPGDAPKKISIADIEVEVVAIPHAGGKRMAEVRNLVFRVTLNDQLTVLHMGDAAPETQAFAAQQPHWDERTTHHAFPPYWFFEAPDGKRILTNHLRPNHSTGVHVPAAATGNGDEWRERLDADLFTDPGEQRTLSTE